MVWCHIHFNTINNFIYQFAKKGLDTQNWKLWWHTHYDFGVFWSMTDEDNIKNLITLSKNFLVSVVINKKGEVLSRLDLGGKEYSIDLKIQKTKIDLDLKKQCQKQINKLVKIEKPYNFKLINSQKGFYVYEYE